MRGPSLRQRQGGRRVITQIEGLPENVIGFEAKGEVTSDDYDNALVPAIQAQREKFGSVRFLYVLGDDFEGYSGGAMWDDAKLGFDHPRSWEKVAIVTDSDWIERSVKALGWMIPGEIKVFDDDDLDDAKEWIAA